MGTIRFQIKVSFKQQTPWFNQRSIIIFDHTVIDGKATYVRPGHAGHAQAGEPRTWWRQTWQVCASSTRSRRLDRYQRPNTHKTTRATYEDTDSELIPCFVS